MIGKARAKKILQAGGVASLVASIANAAVFFLDTNFLNVNFLVLTAPHSTELMKVTIYHVIGSSVFGALLATAVFLALDKLFQKPAKYFIILSLLFLIASFYAPFVLGEDLRTKIALSIMHVVSGSAIMRLFLKMAKELGLNN